MFPTAPHLSLDVNADHSCNWKCCFGQPCPSDKEAEEKAQVAPPTATEPQAPAPLPILEPIPMGERAVSNVTNASSSVDRVEIIFHRHRHEKRKSVTEEK